MSVEAARLTKETCYVSIAEKRCAVGGISQIVNFLLEGVFQGFEEVGVKMSPERRSKVQSTAGQKMGSFLTTEYVNKLIGVYKKALSGLSEEELNEVAQHPTANADYSEAHRKFHQNEQAEFLPIKEKTIDELMEIGIKLVNEHAIIAEIYELVTASK